MVAEHEPEGFGPSQHDHDVLFSVEVERALGVGAAHPHEPVVSA